MNTRTLALCGLATVLGLGITFGVSAQTSTPPLAGAAAQRSKEKHPELKAALRALRNAKTKLNMASRDFDGHRAKAVEHTEAAITEVEAAIASDKQ